MDVSSQKVLCQPGICTIVPAVIAHRWERPGPPVGDQDGAQPPSTTPTDGPGTAVDRAFAWASTTSATLRSASALIAEQIITVPDDPPLPDAPTLHLRLDRVRREMLTLAQELDPA